MRQAFFIGLITILAGCGGGDRFRGDNISRGAPMAFGPISKACMASDREARSRRLCGCVQWVADQSLSRSDQRRAAGFYGDPHSAQEIRQSDRRRDERFWKAYSDYGDRAARICG